MTLIAAITDGKTVYMGADSGSTVGHITALLAEPKLYQRGELLIGESGSVRACQVARYKFAPPPVTDDLHAYFAGAFWDALEPLLYKDDPIDLLIGVRGQIFRIFANGAVTQDPSISYAAIGQAAHVALGALCVSSHLPEKSRLFLALSAGKKHCVNIRPPFIYEQTKEYVPCEK